jgi:hypothetical protein
VSDRFGTENEGEEDRRLAALLRATHAPANPAVWQRVRAELSATAPAARARGFDAVLAWFTRPAALAAATAALLVSLGAGYRMLDSVVVVSSEDAVAYEASPSLLESLLDDSAATTGEAGDAGNEAGDAPTDSGGSS